MANKFPGEIVMGIFELMSDKSKIILNNKQDTNIYYKSCIFALCVELL